MAVLAHIANIPVEEWLPFVAPVVALYVYGRRRERKRREAVEELPEAKELLDTDIVELVLARWREGKHGDAAARHLPLLYPPGPDGVTVAQLAERCDSDADTVEGLLAELAELGYVDLEGAPGPEQVVWLTIEGYEIVSATESVLLASAQERRSPQPQPS